MEHLSDGAVAFAAYRNVLRNFADARMVLEISGCEDGDSYTHTKELSGRGVLDRYREFARDWQDRKDMEAIASATTLPEMIKAMNGAVGSAFEWGLARVLSVEAYALEQREVLMLRITPTVVFITAKHGAQFNTISFLDALEKELTEARDDWKTYREGMQEDGLCRGWGPTVDEWYDDYNSTPDAVSRLEAVKDYMAKYSPVIVAAWREMRGKDKQNDKSGDCN